MGGEREVMKIFCFTSDKHLWALKAYAHLHEKYWGAPVTVVGFTFPDFKLPSNFEFVSVGKFEDYPVTRWSDAIIEFLRSVDDELFIWSFEDYWLLRQVDRSAISILEAYMDKSKDIVRMDLTLDRANNKGVKFIGSTAWLDLVESDVSIPYHFSTQMSIWRRKALLSLLRPGETPWECELNANNRMVGTNYRVVGTRQSPLKYLIAIQQGEIRLNGGYQGWEYGLSYEDLMSIHSLGYLEGVYV